MEREIPKVYAPETIEPRWARFWVERKLYRPGDDPAHPRFSLVIPPPNVTGSLHMGHMMEHTEIDIMMRWRRMEGKDALWLPGMDHASISTQMVVERELGREALPELEPGPETLSAWQAEGRQQRLKMGREKFIERCWQWKASSGGAIRRQMERLGASCDWTRERFTMDPAYTRAVTEVFVRLYEDGLIYRGQYIVNWCPRCGTAISDLEVGHEDRQGKLWSIRYPLVDGLGAVTVATTRPETMLGDTAIAVNPEDSRYMALVGRTVRLPLVGREIPIVADAGVDPAFGTGALKVTPAHDPHDFEIARRHDLASISVIGFDARTTEHAGRYQGLDRYEAREAVLADLQAAGLLEKAQDHLLTIGLCQRCKTVVEPLLSMQWFMKMQPLAAPALKAVEEGRVRILPESGLKKYLNWMNNIHDWCISRQLWWGLRIPAWRCEGCGETVVARETPTACPRCRHRSLRPDPDVLDTWFSSALWPFATLGWPEDAPDLARFYPTDLMIMGEDILFFWGARMMMMGLKFTNDVPFRELYIHGLVRDAERQKMSKTKGNVLDPLEITEQYGTDAVRFALAVSAAPGTDIAFSQEKVESYRAFANKVWNAGRFILMNLGKLPETVKSQIADSLEPAPGLGLDAVAGSGSEDLAAGVLEGSHIQLADRWIFSRLAVVTRNISQALASYRFHEAAHELYHFFWNEFCDWYLEWVKPSIAVPPEGHKAHAAWTNLMRAFEAALHLLHPLMPFITEELWHQLPRREEHKISLSLEPFSLVTERALDPVSEKQFQTIQELVIAARNARAEMNLKKPSAQVASEDLRVLELLREHQEAILRLAGLTAVHFSRGRLAKGPTAARSTSCVEFRLLFEEREDAAGERQRLEKRFGQLQQSLAEVRKQLENPDFMNRAPRAVVQSVERRHAELAAQQQKIAESLERFQAGG